MNGLRRRGGRTTNAHDVAGRHGGAGGAATGNATADDHRSDAGAYIVLVDDAGALKPGADPILANAAKNWLYPPLDTFSVCYQPGTGRADLNVAVAATEAVAKRLKALGVGTVVVPPGGRCMIGQGSTVVSGAHVYIHGAIRY